MKALFLIRRPPYAGTAVHESLEAALVAGVFDMDVSLLFLEAGVTALASEQDASELGVKTVGNVLTGFSAYEIEKIFVCEDSVGRFNLTESVVDVERLSLTDQAVLIADQDVVFAI